MGNGEKRCHNKGKKSLDLRFVSMAFPSFPKRENREDQLHAQLTLMRLVQER